MLASGHSGLARRLLIASGVALAATSLPAHAQSVLFDFDLASVHSALPLDQTIGSITAHFSAPAGGFSIQPVGTLGIAPAGMSGNYIYPDSVFEADLLVGFSAPMVDFSIVIAPYELACDSSATLRVTGYVGAVAVGTNTVSASTPGTWPASSLTLSVPGGFDNVVVHYDAVPPVGCDYAPVFFADNMQVTPQPDPIFANSFE